MIVRNEAATLDKCLSLARPHVDEVVVIDTGSTDGSQEIARQYADVFEEIEWPGSFAVARNHSFDRASGDFILVLDGDEYIPEPDHWKLLRGALATPRLAGLMLTVVNLMGTNRYVAAETIEQERVFRNHPHLRYDGSVHNQIRSRLAAFCSRRNMEVRSGGAEIIHTGYQLAPEAMRLKYVSRLPLLRREVEENTDPVLHAYYLYQLANALMAVGEPAEAARLLNALDFNSLTPENAFYVRLLAVMANRSETNLVASLVHAGEAIRLNPDEPIGYVECGVTLHTLGRMNEALLMFMEAYDRSRTGRTVRFPLNDAHLYRFLGLTCHASGRTERALFFLNEYLKLAPQDEPMQAIVSEMQCGVAACPS